MYEGLDQHPIKGSRVMSLYDYFKQQVVVYINGDALRSKEDLNSKRGGIRKEVIKGGLEVDE